MTTPSSSSTPIAPVPLENPIRSQDEGFANGLRQLFVGSEFCDIAFNVGGTTLLAHRAIVASLSAPFRKYLQQRNAKMEPACSDNSQAMDDPMDGMLSDGATASGADTVAQGGAGAAEQESTTAPTPMPEACGGPGFDGVARNRLELQVKGIASAEAMKIMLSYMYNASLGFEWAFQPSSFEVHKDALRLAKQFQLEGFFQQAGRHLQVDLNTANVVERLVTCEEFQLDTLHDKILEQLTSSPMELAVVSSSPEIMKHPRILQHLLMQVASNKSAAKREPPAQKTEEGAGDKPEKVEKGPALNVKRAKKSSSA